MEFFSTRSGLCCVHSLAEFEMQVCRDLTAPVSVRGENALEVTHDRLPARESSVGDFFFTPCMCRSKYAISSTKLRFAEQRFKKEEEEEHEGGGRLNRNSGNGR